MPTTVYEKSPKFLACFSCLETCKCYWCRFFDAAHATIGSTMSNPRPSRRSGAAH